MPIRSVLRKSVLAQILYRRFNWYFNLRFEPAPWSVALETAAPCNRSCSYCPVSLHPRSGEMPRPLFDKIISDLASLGFSRTLSFHFYNEPLLDPRLPAWVQHARSRLPRAHLDLSTNGDHLTSSRISELFQAGLDGMHISLHSASAAKHVGDVLDSIHDGDRARVTVQSMFDREEKGEFLYNRIEMAEAETRSGPSLSLGVGCSQVNSLMIDFEGNTALCCNDFFAANGHGSLRDVSVRELWRQSRTVRREIYLGRYDKPICKICNVGAREG